MWFQLNYDLDEYQDRTSSYHKFVECVIYFRVVLACIMEGYCQLSKRYATYRSNMPQSSYLVKVVEILFARGLVKVLFATETFAMVSRNKEFPHTY